MVPSVERAIWRVDKMLAPYHVSRMDAYYADPLVALKSD
jgi:hypothetical protein